MNAVQVFSHFTHFRWWQTDCCYSSQPARLAHQIQTVELLHTCTFTCMPFFLLCFYTVFRLRDNKMLTLKTCVGLLFFPTQKIDNESISRIDNGIGINKILPIPIRSPMLCWPVHPPWPSPCADFVDLQQPHLTSSFAFTITAMAARRLCLFSTSCFVALAEMTDPAVLLGRTVPPCSAQHLFIIFAS